jgi:hypothetical protein
MEDQDASIANEGGRVGVWNILNDNSVGATQTPEPPTFTMSSIAPARSGSLYAARSAGSGFNLWGAGFGFDLNGDGETKSAFDASAFTGITFWAMTGLTKELTIRMTVGDGNTSKEGGVCTETASGCNDHFAANLVLVPGEWKQYTVLFSELAQDGWGEPFPAPDASTLYSIWFTVGARVDFDIWVDDIAFTE